ncbi:hypothetical protein [Neobacillus niacini]|nr:hypothetical protein [Neobacillus niacini]MDR7001601.1 hypothetical protein [Neobacillus niacini]
MSIGMHVKLAEKLFQIAEIMYLASVAVLGVRMGVRKRMGTVRKKTGIH